MRGLPDGPEENEVGGMREYANVVEVCTDHEAQPVSFVWRGRRYRVLTVLERWRESTPWWRIEGCVNPADLERVIWRLEAAPGQLTSSGVFDLAQGRDGWLLERMSD